MKKALYLLTLFTLLISCSESEEPIPPETPQPPVAVEQGGQSFNIANKEITAKNSSNLNGKDYIPSYVFISLENSDGNKILDRQKLDVVGQGGDYVTEEIMLDAGTYKLTEFIVVDSDDLVISLVPKATSALSQFTGTSLPFDFTVEESDSKNTPVENIEAAGYSWVEFGYEEDDLALSEAEDFFTLTVDDSENLTTKTFSLISLTGSTYKIDWGDGTVDEYVSILSGLNLDNELTHKYEENGVYEIKIIGAIKVIEKVEFRSWLAEDEYQSNLVSADISGLSLLKEIVFHAGELTNLDTSQNPSLEFLGVSSNQLTSLDLTNNEKLKSLYGDDNQLNEIVFPLNSVLDFISVKGNQFSNLDVSNNSNLRVLIARENPLTHIDFTNNLILERFDLSDNLLSEIDLSQNLNLTEINVGRNNLTQIDLSKNTELERIDLYFNQISSIDLSSNLNLNILYIMGNMLSDIDLSLQDSLETLAIYSNNLDDLDLSNNPMVRSLSIGDNEFDATQLDLIISGVYDNAVMNSINSGYIDYQLNPGTDLIDQTTIAKINELGLDYDWTFNNNQFFNLN
ncbi:hypothetical protein J4E06_14990 [Muricauda sp. NFXS6]|uniref:leucine-rich repeat domain-containing protein n=1 Tax=Flavobacteriaceae TaxID=49546 RepID=UPI0032E04D34